MAPGQAGSRLPRASGAQSWEREKGLVGEGGEGPRASPRCWKGSPIHQAMGQGSGKCLHLAPVIKG